MKPIQRTKAPRRTRDLLVSLTQAPWLIQGAKFLVVGVLNTSIDAGLYFVLTRLLGLGAFPVLAKGISYGAGVLNSFYCNKRWTFRSDARTLVTLAPFVLANLIALAVNAGVMHLCLDVAGLHELLSLTLATGAAFLWNFTLSKFLIFRK